MTVCTVSIRSYSSSPKASHHEHDVSFNNTLILTTVTNSPSVVDQWIAATKSKYDSQEPPAHGRRGCLLVGLDTEWRLTRGNPVALLQLCVENSCLVFQLVHASNIPDSLQGFLSHNEHIFVGVGVANDARKLRHDFGLEVSKTVDLAKLAPSQLAASTDLPSTPGLKFLALKVLGVDMEKSKSITRSRWDNHHLSVKQVQYACVDAYVSYEIGKIWKAWESEYIVTEN